MRPALLVAVALVLYLGACGLPDPGARVRVVEAAPSGADVNPEVVPSIGFSGAVAPDGLLDGRRVLLATETGLHDALEAVESEEGAGAEVDRVACAIALEAEATRLVLRPVGPLRGGGAYALVLSSRALAADGRRVLDAEGRLLPTVVRFVVARPPPPAVFLTELLADAATPEAGGEYAEVLDLGPGPLDLAGWRFEKRLSTGSWSGCTIGEGWGDATGEGTVALVVGGSWDGRYDVPPGVTAFPCGATSLAGGIANDRAPVVRLLDPSGNVAALLDATAVPACAGALEAIPPAPDEGGSGCCACTDGSPGLVPPISPTGGDG